MLHHNGQRQRSLFVILEVKTPGNGNLRAYLVKSAVDGAIEGPAHDFAGTMDGGGGGFYGVCGLF